MDLVLFGTGVIITLFVVYDMTFTILSPKGAGFIADRTTRGIWRLTLNLSGKNGRNRILTFAGPLILLAIVLTWIILLWVGNTMIVLSDDTSLWSSARNAHVTDVPDKAYFIAYVLSSMGSGDFTPNGDWWMIYTGFISFTGVVFISLGISFLIPVVEAITLKRQIALQIHALGTNPKNILQNYDSDGFKDFMDRLDAMEPSLIKLSQYHLAYPIIHYFHSTKHFEALPIKLVGLDEAMSILMYEVSKNGISDVQILRRAYSAMTYYLSTLAEAFILPGDDEPEHPETSYLTDVSPKDSIHGERSDSDLVLRRKLLLAYLQNDGWEWKDMVNGRDAITLDKN